MGTTTSSNFYSNCENLNVANITDINGIVSCANNLKGQKSDSASPSDLLLFDFKINTNYEGENITKGFQKIFISNYDELISRYNIEMSNNNKIDISDHKKKIDILFYEYYVYLNKIKNLLDRNVNPHFVKVIGGKLDVNYNNMKKYILDKVDIDTSIKLNRNDIIKFNFTNNFISMSHSLLRDSLTENIDRKIIKDVNYFIIKDNKYSPTDLYTKMYNIIENVKYGFIMTEGIDLINIFNFKQFIEMPLYKGIALKKFVILTNKSDNYLYYFCFQLVSACYALFLTGINHNDMHFGNILIKKVKPHINEYHINDKVYKILIDYKIIIYDFDRAYCESYNESKKYENIYLSDYKNHLIYNNLFLFKDIFKIFMHLYHVTNDINKKKLLSIISKNYHVNELKKLFNTKNESGDINYWIETYITKAQLSEDNYNSIDFILEKLFLEFKDFNKERLSKEDQNSLNTHIYVCNPLMFSKGNILDNNFNTLKNYFQLDCIDSLEEKYKSEIEKYKSEIEKYKKEDKKYKKEDKKEEKEDKKEEKEEEKEDEKEDEKEEEKDDEKDEIKKILTYIKDIDSCIKNKKDFTIQKLKELNKKYKLNINFTKKNKDKLCSEIINALNKYKELI